MMDAIKAILTKRDTRSYDGRSVDDAVLERVLTAGRMAGSAKNSQLTRIVVATEQATRDALAACGDFTGWIGTAPVVLVFVVPVDGGRIFDVGRMAQNVMLAAHALGLASCPVTFHHQDRMRDVIGLPDDHEGPMGVTLGYAAAAAPPNPLRSPRVPLDELVHRERFRAG